MVEGFKHWRVYVEGAQHPVQVYTDHKNLQYFSEARTTSRRHARWAATLAAYGRAQPMESPMPSPADQTTIPLPSPTFPFSPDPLSIPFIILPTSLPPPS